MELQQLPQWCVCYDDKVPMYEKNGKLVNSSVRNPDKWMTFKDAYAALHKHSHNGPMYMGFVLTKQDPYVCIDMDVKDEDNEPDSSKWTSPHEFNGMKRIVDEFATYSELSKSGKGFHVWCKGQTEKGCRRGGVELYSSERFIICTGNAINQLPIEDRKDLVALMYLKMNAQEPELQELVEVEEEYSDQEIIDMATNAQNGGKYVDLCNGLWDKYGYPSQSEADLALMSMLCFYSKSNEQCRRLFRASALGKREKATQDNKYLDRTIKQARSSKLVDAKTNNQLNSNELVQSRSDYFTVLTEEDLLKLPPIQWRIKKLIPEKGIGCIYGASGSGKSFLVIDLLAHIANGINWFGHKVKETPTLYIPLEGQGGIPNRIDAWIQHHANKGYQQTNIEFIWDGFNLDNDADKTKLIDTLKCHNWRGGVICIDTLAQSAAGVDENNSKDMGKLLATLQQIQKLLDFLIILIHHTGKDQSKGMRGWSGLFAAMDFAFECQNVKDGRCLTVQKLKDGENNRSFNFTLQPITLGQDDDGENITSCAVIFDGAIGVLNKNTILNQNKRDEDFIYQWVKNQVDNGYEPSKRSLRGDLRSMKAKYPITQKRIDSAIEQLLEQGRLRYEDKSQNGNQWLNYVPENTLPMTDNHSANNQNLQ